MPEKSPEADSGLYQLIISLPKQTGLSPGKLGKFQLSPGLYIYTGSARRNLQARLARHAREEKRLRWHVDYLLQYGIIKKTLIYPVDVLTECHLNILTLEALKGEVPISGFGASDCRCGGHLIKCPAGLTLGGVIEAVYGGNSPLRRRIETEKGRW